MKVNLWDQTQQVIPAWGKGPTTIFTKVKKKKKKKEKGKNYEKERNTKGFNENKKQQ